LFIPILSAFIGWITNYIAVKMIFRPRLPRVVFGIKLWGLIPKRKTDLALKIGETVENELISHDDIHMAINSVDFQQELMASVMEPIDNFINKKLKDNPLLAMFASENIITQLKDTIKNELQKDILPGFLEKMFVHMEEKINFKEIVRKKVEDFDFERFEQIIYAIASKELRAIELLGAVLGFIIGLLQVGIFYLGKV